MINPFPFTEDTSAPDTLTKEQFDVTLAAVKGNEKTTSYGNNFNDYFYESSQYGYGGYNDFEFDPYYGNSHDSYYGNTHYSPTGSGNPTGFPPTTPYQNIWANTPPPSPAPSPTPPDDNGDGGSGNDDPMTTEFVSTDDILMGGSTSMDGISDNQTSEFPDDGILDDQTTESLDDLFMTTDETPPAGERKKRDVGTTTTAIPPALTIPMYDGKK